jgi:hypothetical protein
MKAVDQVRAIELSDGNVFQPIVLELEEDNAGRTGLIDDAQFRKKFGIKFGDCFPSFRGLKGSPCEGFGPYRWNLTISRA